ncbi:MAG TPA: hypothetical protein VMR89_04180 [Actinomycetota bacterium]|nr:hypothetical protein [Actinomycetota bacterium]
MDKQDGRVILHFPLSDVPPPEWREYVNSRWETVARAEGYQPPTAKGDIIVIESRPSRQDFRDWTSNADTAIANANRYYSETILGDRQGKRDAAHEVLEQRRELLEEARGWIDEELDPPS